MSTVDDKLLRYEVLNRCLRDIFREYTIDNLVDEVNIALRNAYDKTASISKRTIQDDLAQLQLPPYSIKLNETLKKGRKKIYRYSDPDYTLQMFHMTDKERNKVKEAIRVLRNYEGEPLYDWARSFLIQVAGGLLTDDKRSVVSFQTNPDLKGLQHFSKLLQAILSKRVLKLEYTPYGKDSYSVTIFPYHLKQYNDRWYLIAKNLGYDSLALYALDRIDGFREVSLKYREPDIDFEEYFDDIIGVTLPEKSEAVDVILRVSNDRFNYIRTKPIHLSQRIVSEEKHFTTISINVKINRELIAKILSFDSDMEVVSPASLRTEMIKIIRDMNNLYTNSEEFLHT